MKIVIDGSGTTSFLGKKIEYQVGKNGITSNKTEGDFKTPIGIIRPLMVYYRADRVIRPKTSLPIRQIYPHDGWCDNPKDFSYNNPVRYPYKKSAENLVRQDHAYDYIIVTDYNYPDAIPHKGSAIFIHVMHCNKRATAGCIAFEKNMLKRMLHFLTPKDEFVVF